MSSGVRRSNPEYVMLSVRIFFKFGPKNFGKLLRPFVSVNSDFFLFSLFWYFKNYRKYWISYMHAPLFKRILSSEHMGQELMRVRKLWAPWLYASVPYVHVQHANQCSYFKMFILCILSVRVRNWCVRWAYTSQELVCALSMRVRYQSMHRAQSLQNMLSIRIRNWYVPWTYGSGNDAFAEHTHQELTPALSIRISFLHVCSA